ncbi:hypothetical protein OG897_23370 [Streptomyces sp. NBC_00237]|uniref:hypothetical protein n=1 Tax=Streptomyces sp. NBC_00237 TaxID=2975687 RepID=UPI0022586571|nr:hypothetical protein [Streptomyces sp. NBC_00237]MCX5204380.1 hypothetical protein [Streptomyces sp. NBC_00237]
MTVDPTDPDDFREDDDTTPDLTPETPEADAAEQHTDLTQLTDDPLPTDDPASANAADVAEQARVVALDEDDYR